MNSNDKYQERLEKELEEILEETRKKFAGQKIVSCATGLVNKTDYFDFTNIKSEDIRFGLHGTEYIIAKARNISTGEIKPCYLKYITRKAVIVESSKNYDHVVAYSSFNNQNIFAPPRDLNKNLDLLKKGIAIMNREKEKPSPSNFETFVTTYCNNLRDMLIEKNKSYGNSALDPVRIFSTADSEEQIKVRLDDKLSRIKRGNNAFDEDTVKDLIGYLVLLQYKKQ